MRCGFVRQQATYNSRIRGLTLVELMVVVAVLAIVSTIAYPIYTQQAQKARRTDGRQAVMSVALAAERWFARTGSYDTVSLSSLAIPSGIDGGSISGLNAVSVGGHYDVEYAPSGVVFSVTAAPRGAQSDDVCTEMTINQLGVKAGSGAKCW